MQIGLGMARNMNMSIYGKYKVLHPFIVHNVKSNLKIYLTFVVFSKKNCTLLRLPFSRQSCAISLTDPLLHRRVLFMLP